MLAKERQNQIVEQVNEKGSVLVKDLSEQFSVTEDSIRKDLTLLQKKGLLKKTYGGAMKVRVNAHEYFVSERKGKNLPEKRTIAQRALSLIEEGDVLFLDISTSSLELAQLLAQSEKQVTVVTNMIDVMEVFRGDNPCKLICIGGTFSLGKDGFVGALTNQEIEQFRFDKAFMGVVGVDLENNSVTTYQAEDATTKKAILKCSRKSYMLLETRKLYEEGNFVYASVDSFTGAILEKNPEVSFQSQMERYSLEWITE